MTKSRSLGAEKMTSTENDNGRSPGGLDLSPIHLLHRAGQYAGDVFSEQVRGGDLTPRQYAVLLTVADNEGLSQTELVARTGIDRSTLADIVRRMQKKGLLRRRRTKQDARAYAVRLTEEGWRALRQAQPAAAEADQRILAVLPPSKRDEFLNTLTALVEAIEVSEGNGTC